MNPADAEDRVRFAVSQASLEAEMWSDIPVQSHVDFQFEDEEEIETNGNALKVADETVDLHKDGGSSPDDSADHGLPEP